MSEESDDLAKLTKLNHSGEREVGRSRDKAGDPHSLHHGFHVQECLPGPLRASQAHLLLSDLHANTAAGVCGGGDGCVYVCMCVFVVSVYFHELVIKMYRISYSLVKICDASCIRVQFVN